MNSNEEKFCKLAVGKFKKFQLIHGSFLCYRLNVVSEDGKTPTKTSDEKIETNLFLFAFKKLLTKKAFNRAFILIPNWWKHTIYKYNHRKACRNEQQSVNLITTQ